MEHYNTDQGDGESGFFERDVEGADANGDGENGSFSVPDGSEIPSGTLKEPFSPSPLAPKTSP